MSQIGLHTTLNTPLLTPTGGEERNGAAEGANARPGAADAGRPAAPREARERALRDMPPPDRHLAGSADRGPDCPKPSASTCREGERWRFPAEVWRA